MEIDVLVPAYNEAQYIGRTVAALRLLPGISELVVIDDGSTDDTAQVAKKNGATVIRLPVNGGKAAAVLCGAQLVRQPYLAIIDADLGDSVKELPRLIKPLQEGGAEMTVAIFPRGRAKGGLGLVKKLAAWSIYRSSGLVYKEPLSGQRVMKRDLLTDLRYPPRGFGLEVALTLDALNQGYTVLEVQTVMCHRERGRDLKSCLHRGRQLKDLLREIWRRRDMLLKGGGN
jgi:glycosyltransferase involved in cell wall biosynthesis